MHSNYSNPQNMKRDTESLDLYSDSSASASTVEFLDGLFETSSCSSQWSVTTRSQMDPPRSLQRRSNSDPISFKYEEYQSTSVQAEEKSLPMHHALINLDVDSHIPAYQEPQHAHVAAGDGIKQQSDSTIAGRAEQTSPATLRSIYREKFKHGMMPRSFSEPAGLAAFEHLHTARNIFSSPYGGERSLQLRISHLLASDLGNEPPTLQHLASSNHNSRREQQIPSILPTAIFIPGISSFAGNRIAPQNPLAMGNTAVDSESLMSLRDFETRFTALQAACANPRSSDEQADEAEFPKQLLSRDLKKDGTTDVHAEDILLGRGRSLLTHPGNIRLRSIVDKHREVYKGLENRDEKTALSKIILRQAKEAGPNGHQPRFLKYQREKNGWVVVGDSEARNKISHLFRDKPRRKVKNSPTSLASKSKR